MEKKSIPNWVVLNTPDQPRHHQARARVIRPEAHNENDPNEITHVRVIHPDSTSEGELFTMDEITPYEPGGKSLPKKVKASPFLRTKAAKKTQLAHPNRIDNTEAPPTQRRPRIDGPYYAGGSTVRRDFVPTVISHHETPDEAYHAALQYNLQGTHLPYNQPEIDASNKQEKSFHQHKFGCLIAMVPDDLAQRILDWSKNIPDAHLDLGKRELFIHITTKFGFLDSSTQTLTSLKNLLSKQKPFKVKLGGLSQFKGNEEGDVLKVEVSSKELVKINKKVSESFPCNDKYGNKYQPHLTLAFILPAFSNLYEEVNFPFENEEFEVENLLWSGADGHKEIIQLLNDVVGKKDEKAMDKFTRDSIQELRNRGENTAANRIRDERRRIGDALIEQGNAIEQDDPRTGQLETSPTRNERTTNEILHEVEDEEDPTPKQPYHDDPSNPAPTYEETQQKKSLSISSCPVCGGHVKKLDNFEGWRCINTPCEWSIFGADIQESSKRKAMFNEGDVVRVKPRTSGIHPREGPREYKQREEFAHPYTGQDLHITGRTTIKGRPAYKVAMGSESGHIYADEIDDESHNRKEKETYGEKKSLGDSIVRNLRNTMVMSVQNTEGVGPGHHRLFYHPLEQAIWYDASQADDGDSITEILHELQAVEGVKKHKQSIQQPPPKGEGWLLVWPTKQDKAMPKTRRDRIKERREAGDDLAANYLHRQWEALGTTQQQYDSTPERRRAYRTRIEHNQNEVINQIEGTSKEKEPQMPIDDPSTAPTYEETQQKKAMPPHDLQRYRQSMQEGNTEAAESTRRNWERGLTGTTNIWGSGFNVDYDAPESTRYESRQNNVLRELDVEEDKPDPRNNTSDAPTYEETQQKKAMPYRVRENIQHFRDIGWNGRADNELREWEGQNLVEEEGYEAPETLNSAREMSQNETLHNERNFEPQMPIDNPSTAPTYEETQQKKAQPGSNAWVGQQRQQQSQQRRNQQAPNRYNRAPAPMNPAPKPGGNPGPNPNPPTQAPRQQTKPPKYAAVTEPARSQGKALPKQPFKVGDRVVRIYGGEEIDLPLDPNNPGSYDPPNEARRGVVEVPSVEGYPAEVGWYDDAAGQTITPSSHLHHVGPTHPKKAMSWLDSNSGGALVGAKPKVHRVKSSPFMSKSLKKGERVRLRSNHPNMPGKDTTIERVYVGEPDHINFYEVSSEDGGDRPLAYPDEIVEERDQYGNHKSYKWGVNDIAEGVDIDFDVNVDKAQMDRIREDVPPNTEISYAGEHPEDYSDPMFTSEEAKESQRKIHEKWKEKIDYGPHKSLAKSVYQPGDRVRHVDDPNDAPYATYIEPYVGDNGGVPQEEDINSKTGEPHAHWIQYSGEGQEAYPDEVLRGVRRNNSLVKSSPFLLDKPASYIKAIRGDEKALRVGERVTYIPSQAVNTDEEAENRYRGEVRHILLPGSDIEAVGIQYDEGTPNYVPRTVYSANIHKGKGFKCLEGPNKGKPGPCPKEGYEFESADRYARGRKKRPASDWTRKKVPPKDQPEYTFYLYKGLPACWRREEHFPKVLVEGDWQVIKNIEAFKESAEEISKEVFSKLTGHNKQTTKKVKESPFKKKEKSLPSDREIEVTDKNRPKIVRGLRREDKVRAAQYPRGTDDMEIEHVVNLPAEQQQEFGGRSIYNVDSDYGGGVVLPHEITHVRGRQKAFPEQEQSNIIRPTQPNRTTTRMQERYRQPEQQQPERVESQPQRREQRQEEPTQEIEESEPIESQEQENAHDFVREESREQEVGENPESPEKQVFESQGWSTVEDERGEVHIDESGSFDIVPGDNGFNLVDSHTGQTISSSPNMDSLKRQASHLKAMKDNPETEVEEPTINLDYQERETEFKKEYEGKNDNYFLTLFGVPDGQIKATEAYNRHDFTGVNVRITHPDVQGEAERVYGINSKGEKVIRNNGLELKRGSRGQGKGSAMFSTQVAQAIKDGYSEITTTAGGDFKSAIRGFMNGSYSWVALGYNASLESVNKQAPELAFQIKDQFPNAKDLLDVFTTEEVVMDLGELELSLSALDKYDQKRGRPYRNRTKITGAEWWLLNCRGLDLTFDLRDGSKSRDHLAGYIEAMKGSGVANDQERQVQQT